MTGPAVEMATRPCIATVTMNAAIDQTVFVPRFTVGTVNRVMRHQADAGGKGVNVAAFLSHFGYRVAVTGLLGRANLEPFAALFAERGIDDRFVRVDGATRVNIKIVDAVQNRVTDINFPGVDGDRESLAAVFAAVDALAAEGVRTFVLSGSLPGGVPTDTYRALVVRLKARGAQVVLDASGAPLARAIDAAPDVIKPNLDELRELSGRTLAGETEIVRAARAVVDRGVGLVAVSRGDRGAIFVTATEALSALPPAIAVKSTVGAGDAMVAGIVHATQRGLPLAGIAALASAVSLGAVGEIGPRLPAPETIDGLARRVAIRPVAA